MHSLREVLLIGYWLQQVNSSFMRIIGNPGALATSRLAVSWLDPKDLDFHSRPSEALFLDPEPGYPMATRFRQANAADSLPQVQTYIPYQL